MAEGRHFDTFGCGNARAEHERRTTMSTHRSARESFVRRIRSAAGAKRKRSRSILVGFAEPDGEDTRFE